MCSSELDAPVAEIHKRQLGHMSPTQLKTLAELLDAGAQRRRRRERRIT